ncbi:MAG: alpha/beta fold hydrolase [Bacilli bacterium]
MLRRNSKDGRATIVLVHGLFAHSARYYSIAQTLNKLGFHVLAGDLPGQGKQLRLRGDVREEELYIQCIAEWVEEAKQLGAPVFLYGQGFGAVMVLRYVMSVAPADVQGLLLSAPTFRMNAPVYPLERILQPVLNVLAPGLRVPLADEIRRVTSDSDTYYHIKNDPMKLKKMTVRAYEVIRMATEKAFQQADTVPNIPMYVMTASDDQFADNAAIAEWISRVALKDKTVQSFEGFSHELLFEKRANDVIEEMAAWMMARAQ